MEKQEFDTEKLINYWITSSDEDYYTMLAMFESKRFNRAFSLDI